MSEFMRAMLEELSQLARDPDTRVVQQSTDEPIHWGPTTVIDPSTGAPFTDAGAWEFIAQHLTSGEPVNTVTLKKPPGKAGFTMNIATPSGVVYFKLRMGKGKVIGRSFHYSKHQ